ncbi:type II toxin-antitoxin system PemK/MazF family toxin [Lachnospiraceae bacterium JLR.KK009]
MCRRGDIFWAELGRDADGSLQAGGRPVLVISNDKANEYSPIITIIPITSKMNKAKLPTHVLIEACGLTRPSIALAEQITSINKGRLGRKIGSIQQTAYVGLIKRAIGIQLCL